MSAAPPGAGSMTEQGSEPACEVYYLRTEPHVGGFRWVIAKSGAVDPVLVGPVFPTDHKAKAAGRADLDRFLAQQNSWSVRCPDTSSDRRISLDL